MALFVHNRGNPVNEAGLLPATLLSQPFAAVGKAVIAWIDNLGASAIFLILALMKIFRYDQLSKGIQQLYYIGARSVLKKHLHRQG